MNIIRNTDSQGSFYQCGKYGKKHRYIKGNSSSRSLAKTKAMLQGRIKQCKAPKSKTKAKPKERIYGSIKNKAGSAKNAHGNIQVNIATETSLKKKIRAHNEDNPQPKKRATLGALKAVYRRGAGAFSKSHSPKVKSRQQWAIARVNAYLYLLKNGNPRNNKYISDNDLLPKLHPRSKRA